jgi:hypothetical protein
MRSKLVCKHKVSLRRDPGVLVRHGNKLKLHLKNVEFKNLLMRALRRNKSNISAFLRKFISWVFARPFRAAVFLGRGAMGNGAIFSAQRMERPEGAKERI